MFVTPSMIMFVFLVVPYRRIFFGVWRTFNLVSRFHVFGWWDHLVLPSLLFIFSFRINL